VRLPDEHVGLRLLEPDPYTVFQLSPQVPENTQRIRLTVGAVPGTESVTYVMNGETLGTVHQAPWVFWWTLEQGSHELVAEALLADGTVQTSAVIPFSVTTYAPPQSRTLDN
jgi:hypothetical protein